MPTTFTLHAHEQTSSGDSDTPVRVMAEAYDEAGVDLVGFVGHDARPEVPDDLPVETMTGTEHELQKRPTKLHLLEFPDQNLTILPHPSLTWPENTAANAQHAGEQLGVDAIESFNRGSRELQNEVGFPVVGADDAHNTHQVATSVSETMAPADPAAVANAVKNGQVTPVNNGSGTGQHLAGRLHQAVNMLF